MTILAIKVCKICKGDGFLRIPWKNVHPYTNIAHARAVLTDGREIPARHVVYPKEVTHLVLNCTECNGIGEVGA